MASAYLLDIVIMLAAAVIAVPIFRATGLGIEPGFLVAGILVGPSGLGLIDNVTEIRHLAELGVVLLLFVIGIELKPSRLWLMRRQVFGLGTLQVLVTGAALGAAVFLFFGVSFRTAALIGPILALSSTAFVLQILAEQRSLQSDYGRSTLAVLLLQDLAVVPLLALIPLLAMPELTIGTDIAVALVEALAILVAAIVGGRVLLQPLLHRVALARSKEVFTGLTVLLVLGSAILTEHLGMSMAMGAFIAGLLIADSPFRHEVMAEIEPFRGLLLGLFFVSMGMSLQFEPFLAQPAVILGMLVALIAIKFIVLWPLVVAFGYGTRTGAAVALLLAQSGEFGLVLFAYAFDAALLETTLFQQLLVVVVLSMLVTPPLAFLAQRLAAMRARPPTANQEEPVTAPVVLAGFGRVGRRIGKVLSQAGVPYVAIDNDSSLVLEQRAKGYPVFYGDGRRPDVLRSIGIADARCVIVIIDDFEAGERIVATLREAHPHIEILARGHNATQCRRLRDLGATVAVSENLEASVELARAVLIHAGVAADEGEALLQAFRAEYYADVDEAPTDDPKL
mgnify:CR=1 FL=1